MMNSTDYMMVASVLAQSRPDKNEVYAFAEWELFCTRMANVFAAKEREEEKRLPAFTPTFDRQAFFTACNN